MADERWRRIEDLYHSALAREKEQRTTFLEQACGGDEFLRQEVESLLANDGPDTVLDRPAAHLLAESTAMVVGHYRLMQKIGEGGMGEVWLAEQREPIRRRVALKLVKAGMNTREVMARFESERQALALMDHTGIAKVFDAGATPEGAPYFVMEYVAGIPITEYCDDHRLSTRERLELFMQVCEAVQHAHQKAIIHRDLKPSNVLVVEVDGKPMPRIIDFGLAKATAPLVPGETLFTQMGAFLGTPGYMSPEQADPGVHDVDTRTDVYSLGDSVRTADRVFAVRCSRVEEAAAGGVSSETARRRSAGTEREDQNESGDLGEQSGSAPYGPKTTDESFTRRLGLDDDEGPGERPRTPVRDTVGARRRY
jgi:non-specific serine/threonine protein kinase/serine/threonine-protein kinase